MPSRLPGICTGRLTRAVFHPATDSSCARIWSNRRRRSGRTWSVSRENRCSAWMADAVPPTSTASGGIRCKRAADERTSSQSGGGAALFNAVFFNVVHPEMISLGVGVGNIRAADAFHFFKQRPIPKNRAAQVSPILPAAARDHIVDGRKGQALMVEVAMQPGGQQAFTIFNPAILAGIATACNAVSRLKRKYHADCKHIQQQGKNALERAHG